MTNALRSSVDLKSMPRNSSARSAWPVSSLRSLDTAMGSGTLNQ